MGIALRAIAARWQLSPPPSQASGIGCAAGHRYQLADQLPANKIVGMLWIRELCASKYMAKRREQYIAKSSTLQTVVGNDIDLFSVGT